MTYLVYHTLLLVTLVAGLPAVSQAWTIPSNKDGARSSSGVVVVSNKNAPMGCSSSTLFSSETSWQGDKNALPKLVIFDLDGCLWRPEMYELLYYSGGAGAPFTPSDNDPNILLTRKGEPVYLLGNVRQVMQELHLNPNWKDVKVGISSRTDQPDWARELLQKFQVEIHHDDDAGGSFCLNDVFHGGPIQISSDAKVKHFRRIASETGVALEDMLFFDNEFGNCKDVSSLGVTVAYCPNGVDTSIWEAAVAAFPARAGNIIEVV
jgi:magnesium-dependent phosphatase 1